ncbi:WD repeat-containing protein 78 isoform X4 [Lontra canadensis]|uniref:WD repeat-containing protein 78 isoform X4 n=1 Tax=Lontra canadensis TaxID=76717 RepID=UPI0013F2D5E4|nr:WD repeat-containing protein 78 isoform X4 [Lontra canadensis]
MPVSPVNSRKQQNLWLSVGPQPKKSISFTNTVKGGQTKGYLGANQSRMAMSKTLMVLPEIKTEKMNMPTVRTPIQVINALGVDVTPRPLYQQDPHMATAKPNKLFTSQEGSYGSEYISSYSLYQNTINPSMLGQFTRSVLGSSTVSKSSLSTTDSIAEDLEEPSYRREKLTSFTDLRVVRATPEKIVTKEDLQKTIEIILTETETLRFFNLPTVMVSVESEEAVKVIRRNRTYETLCRNRLGNDLYVERMMQTINGAPKNKEVQCDKIVKEDKEPEPEEPEDFLEGEKLEQETEEEVKKEEEEEIEINTEQSTIPANLERLWSFSCDLTKGLNVSSLAWNKTNPDLLAVGYGHFGFKEQKRGLACCWSIKNPTWPERIYQSPYGVTAVDFSIGAPNLLAVGYHNGNIAIYNVQSNSNVPVLDSSESPQKHLGPVWQLQWIEQDRGTTGDDKREILVSISADGRFSKWVIRKGLDCHDLMRLRRTTTSNSKGGGEKEKKGEALISRQAPGMCFAFHPKDTNIYLAGTEEGHIHKCSCSYNEQYLDTYRGHKGPVYKIAWNPFCHDVFLSCSADWGVIIWQQESTTPFLSFYPTTSVVYDVAWSPKSSYIFAAANESRVEIWDLHVSTLDPLIVNIANPGIKFTTVLFAKQTDCLLVGDSDGQVAVYELRNMPTTLDSGRGDIINTLLGPKPNR